MSLLPSVLAPVKEYFKAMGFEYQDPQLTRVKNIADKSTKTDFPGIYFMYGTDANTGQVIDFYIGLSVDKISSRWATHVPKLQQNAHSLFHMSAKPNKTSTGPRSTWENPTRYRAGVAKQFYAGKDMPDYRVFASKKGKASIYTPGDLTYKGVPLEGRNVMDLPVLIWNLSTWPKGFIKLLEKAMIRHYKPEFNNEKDINEPEMSLEQIQAEADKLRDNPEPVKVKAVKQAKPKIKTAVKPAAPMVAKADSAIDRFRSNLNSINQTNFDANLKKMRDLNYPEETIISNLRAMVNSTFSPSQIQKEA